MRQLLSLLLAGTMGCAGVQTPSSEIDIKAKEESVVEEKPKVKESESEDPKEQMPLVTEIDRRPLTEIAREHYEATPPHQPGTEKEPIPLGNGYEYQYIRLRTHPGLGYKVIVPQGAEILFVDLDAPEENSPIGVLDAVDCSPKKHYYCEQMDLFMFLDARVEKFVRDTYLDTYDNLIRHSNSYRNGKRNVYSETMIKLNIEGLFGFVEPPKKPKIRPNVI